MGSSRLGPIRAREPGTRLTDYTPELADQLCERLAEGRSLRAVCKDDDMPAKSTVFGWLRKHEEFRNQYELAREERAESHADDIVDIADDPSLDPNDKRVRIEARKWIASKLAPKRYGDRQQIEHSGALSLADLVKISFEEDSEGLARER